MLRRRSAITRVCSGIRAATARVDSKPHANDSPGPEGPDATSKGKFDVVIAGGGMVGSAMACALGCNPLFSEHKIALLEPNPLTKTGIEPDFSNRVSAITPGSIKVLEDLGVWQFVCELRAAPFQQMQVWDACGDHSFLMLDSDFTGGKMGFIVENDVLMLAFMKRLQGLYSNVDTYKSKVADINLEGQDHTGSNVSIKLDDNSSISTKLLIAADGPQSFVRNTTGIKHISLPYNQHAVVATLHLAEVTDNVVAWQRFLPNGPIALLPLSKSRSSLVWTTTPNHAKKLLQLPSEEFIDSINEAFVNNDSSIPMVNQIGSIANSVLQLASKGSKYAPQSPPTISGVDDGSRGAFPLSLGHATNYVMHRVALIGDAAHRVHPLAGQGVNLGFKDVQVLSKVLADAVSDGSEVGALPTLLKYEKIRQPQAVSMMAAIDKLNRLFSNDFLPVAVIRGVGFQFVNYLTPIKNRMIKFAMG